MLLDMMKNENNHRTYDVILRFFNIMSEFLKQFFLTTKLTIS